MTDTNSITLVHAIFVVACFIWLAVMAVEDFRKCSLPGVGCLIGWVITVNGALHLSVSLTVLIALLALIALFYSTIELSWFGDADMIPLAMFMVCFGHHSDYILSAGTAYVASAIPIAKLWAKAKNIKWKFGEGVPVPGIPIITIAWLTASIHFFVLEVFALVP